jgi:hypothetical protein
MFKQHYWPKLTHLPDGRIVTPRKIAAANAAALSFFPPLAALTAAILAAAFCLSTGFPLTSTDNPIPAFLDCFFALDFGDPFFFFVGGPVPDIGRFALALGDLDFFSFFVEAAAAPGGG